MQPERNIPDKEADIAEQQSGSDHGKDGPNGIHHDEVRRNNADGNGGALHSGRVDVDILDRVALGLQPERHLAGDISGALETGQRTEVSRMEGKR
jgi:hypothetical protein